MSYIHLLHKYSQLYSQTSTNTYPQCVFSHHIYSLSQGTYDILYCKNSPIGTKESKKDTTDVKSSEVNTEANKKYCEVSRELGLPAGNVEEGKSSLLSFVRILKEKLGIEKCLKDYGVDFEEFRKEIPDILLDIKKDMCTVYNPNKLTDEEYIRLLLKIYFGE